MATALYLQRDGHTVTVLDREGPGEGCSRGNAGIVVLDSVSPLASAAILREIPRMLSDPEAPARIEWRALGVLFPWLPRFVVAARPRQARLSARALAALLRSALDDYRLLFGRGRRAGAGEAGRLAGHLRERDDFRPRASRASAPTPIRHSNARSVWRASARAERLAPASITLTRAMSAPGIQARAPAPRPRGAMTRFAPLAPATGSLRVPRNAQNTSKAFSFYEDLPQHAAHRFSSSWFRFQVSGTRM
ncbi:MAG: hypothetical protein GWN09_04550 [Gammaproteobacteria bacterium]|nr:hypothetical protein [Gammaproteobacteria bacterium]